MTTTSETTASAKLYTAAHAAQYTTKDLSAALKLYQNIIELHGDAQEAEFSRAQIQHIVSASVPKQELFDMQVGLAERYLDGGAK